MTPLDQTAQLAARPAHLAHPANPACSPGRSLPFPVPRPGSEQGCVPAGPPRRRRGEDKAAMPSPPQSLLPLAPALSLGPCAFPLRSTSLSPSFPTTSERRHGPAAVNAWTQPSPRLASVSVGFAIVFLIHRWL